MFKVVFFRFNLFFLPRIVGDQTLSSSDDNEYPLTRVLQCSFSYPRL